MKNIFWIEGKPAAKLGIVLRPEGDGHLADELKHIRRAGIDTLVSLLDLDEAEWLGLAEEAAAAKSAGINFLSYPIPDAHVPPDREDFRKFVSGLADRLRSGEAVGVHCRGCIGRSTVTAACALIHLGWNPEAALEAIEEARGCPIPDTREQLMWILSYEAQP